MVRRVRPVFFSLVGVLLELLAMPSSPRLITARARWNAAPRSLSRG